jgi:putative iron-only hydrogenase system regulator
MKKRLGFVGIVVENRKKSAGQVNQVLTEFGDLIMGRMGVPHLEEDHSVITLIVRATTDEVGSLTGKLGQIEGVSVKSAMTAVK